MLYGVFKNFALMGYITLYGALKDRLMGYIILYGSLTDFASHGFMITLDCMYGSIQGPPLMGYTTL